MARCALLVALLIAVALPSAVAQTNLPSYPLPPPNMLQVPPPVTPPRAPPPRREPVPPVVGPGGPIIIPEGAIVHKRGESFADRAKRCLHLGTAAGIPPSEIGRFTAACAR